MKNKKVFLAGCGGLGCYCVEYLARIKTGTVVAADGDVFDAGNMDRQLYCSIDTIGKSKAYVAAERWPDMVVPVREYICENNIEALLDGCDIAIDALDNVADRKILASACEKTGIPLVHGAIGNTCCQFCVILPGDRDILDIIYPNDNVSTVPTAAYTPALCAAYQISLAHRLLLGEPVEKRTLYTVDLGSMNLERVKL